MWVGKSESDMQKIDTSRRDCSGTLLGLAAVAGMLNAGRWTTTILSRAENQKATARSKFARNRIAWSPASRLFPVKSSRFVCIAMTFCSRRSIFSTRIGAIDCTPASGMLLARCSMIERYDFAASSELGWRAAVDEGSAATFSRSGIVKNSFSARSRICSS